MNLLLFSCGTAVLYATNQETGKTISNLGDIVSDNLDDAKTFVDNTVAVRVHSHLRFIRREPFTR